MMPELLIRIGFINLIEGKYLSEFNTTIVL